MKILLLGTYENDGPNGSMQRFAALMANGLTDAGHEVRFFRPPAFFGQICRSPLGVGKWIGYIDKFATFPPLLKNAVKWAEVVHICDHSNSIYVDYLSSVPHVVTCHDLTAVRSALGETPNYSTRWAGRQLQSWVTNGLKKAQHIVCVSDATKSDLLRITGVRTERVSRIYNAMNHRYFRMDHDRAQHLIESLGLKCGDRFLVQVGGNQWYKNRMGALKIFGELRKLTPGNELKLVTVSDFWTSEMRDFVQGNGLSSFTIELSEISNDQLRALYSTACALLFPSLTEGFGWPILEAQACGCAVVTSNRAPMNEVGGSAAIYIDPENPQGAAQEINRFLFEGLNRLAAPSIQNAARFDPQKMIHDYVAIFESLRERFAIVN